MGIVVPALVAAFAAPSVGPASADTVVASWQLNEGANARVMVDSANGHDGVISAGAKDDGLTTGKSSGGDTYYNWGHITPNVDYLPERVVQVDDSALNPGSDSWAISFRYRTTRKFGNIMQKGQSTTKGGQIKFQLPKGQVSCMFKGGNGQKRSIKTVKSYADGNWHVVRCVRTSSSVTLTVDAGTATAETRVIKGASGPISNSYPFVIGGKTQCDQQEVTCDYFEGDIDWVKVEDLG